MVELAIDQGIDHVNLPLSKLLDSPLGDITFWFVVMSLSLDMMWRDGFG